ncbi:DUF3422 family protein [Pseudoruegeria sp. SK021]|uniref:DUF3422 family protein n=1 Tax=Pseudoruegeria sp. SK021 TaxID=1933035 RepID=UPI000A2658F5|nr:DUF3422 domain-containing protein [Pseudoruegeria sp. SK021]OSP54515.1 hypothetical protein BV911_12335 [Pseudoruegeria sp. SK021]
MIRDHELRYALANELHARPFPVVSAPGTALFLAIKQPQDAAGRDREADRAHLIDLLDRHGAPHPTPGATHYSGEIGKHVLKWESHTEFVTYTLFSDGDTGVAFDGQSFKMLPEDWLDAAPGVRMTSALIRVERYTDPDEVSGKVEDWFVNESVAVSEVVGSGLIIASDFRIDAAGHKRIAVFAPADVTSRQIGRIVQRMCEIEIYNTMSMLGLAMARDLGDGMAPIEARLTRIVEGMSDPTNSAEETLKSLLEIAAELENLSVRSSFRFGASGAYEALVNQRVEVLRETRFQGRQTFAEFMMRRFDPAMRTVKSAERRLAGMTDRANRAGELLRTRVDVERSAQNHQLLEGMNRRAELQLQLQETVEGLSVVAISYYAISISLYVLAPVGSAIGLSKPVIGAMVTPLVVVAVWCLVRRIRRLVH